VPRVAAGVAAGDSAASNANPSAAGTGRSSSSGAITTDSSPTAMSRPMGADGAVSVNSPQTLTVANAPTPTITMIVAIVPGRRASSHAGAPSGSGSRGEMLTTPG